MKISLTTFCQEDAQAAIFVLENGDITVFLSSYKLFLCKEIRGYKHSDLALSWV